MIKKIEKGFILFCVSAFILLCAILQSSAHEVEQLKGLKFAQLALGGLLYDNWPEELRVKLERTHPSYPDAGKQKGETTWRCKECHGWDYKGRKGAYSAGSHFTGIKGIKAYMNRDHEDVMKILRDKTHAYGNLMSEESLEALSLFVAYGQVDMDLFVNPDTNKAMGDPAIGGRIYLSTCTKCHGNDGKAINFGDKEKPEYVGTVANENPWEAFHKIRWGHPGTRMVPLLFLELKEQLDALSFLQTLPQE